MTGLAAAPYDRAPSPVMVSNCFRLLLAASLPVAPARLAASEPRAVDRLVTGGVVVTVDASRRVLDPGAVAVRGERFVAVLAEAEPSRAAIAAAR